MSERNIKKSIFYTFISQIPTQIFGIISGIFITRILGASGRGLYAIMYADVSLFNTIFSFSIATAIIYFISSNKISLSKIFTISIFFSFISIILSVIVLLGWLMLPLNNFLFPIQCINWKYIAWFILILILTQVNTIYSSFFQGIQNFKVVNLVSLSNSILNLIIYGVAFFFYHYKYFYIDLYVILLIGLVVLVLNTLQWHSFYTRYFSYEITLKINWEQDIKPFFSYTGIGHLSNVINFFNYRLVLWILAYYLTELEVGIFSLASGLTQMLTFFTNPLSQVLLPFLSSNTNEDRKTVFIRFARVHFTLIFIMAIVGACIAPFLIPILYGIEFNDSVLPFEILIFGILFSCQTKIIAGFLFADNKVTLNLWATIFGFALTLFFNYYLIKHFGITGASWSSFITYVGIFIFVYGATIIKVNLSSVNLFFITGNDLKYARDKFKRKS